MVRASLGAIVASSLILGSCSTLATDDTTRPASVASTSTVSTTVPTGQGPSTTSVSPPLTIQPPVTAPEFTSTTREESPARDEASAERVEIQVPPAGDRWVWWRYEGGPPLATVLGSRRGRLKMDTNTGCVMVESSDGVVHTAIWPTGTQVAMDGTGVWLDWTWQIEGTTGFFLDEGEEFEASFGGWEIPAEATQACPGTPGAEPYTIGFAEPLEDP